MSQIKQGISNIDITKSMKERGPAYWRLAGKIRFRRHIQIGVARLRKKSAKRQSLGGVVEMEKRESENREKSQYKYLYD